MDAYFYYYDALVQSCRKGNLSAITPLVILLLYALPTKLWLDCWRTQTPDADISLQKNFCTILSNWKASNIATYIAAVQFILLKIRQV